MLVRPAGVSADASLDTAGSLLRGSNEERAVVSSRPNELPVAGIKNPVSDSVADVFSSRQISHVQRIIAESLAKSDGRSGKRQVHSDIPAGGVFKTDESVSAKCLIFPNVSLPEECPSPHAPIKQPPAPQPRVVKTSIKDALSWETNATTLNVKRVESFRSATHAPLGHPRPSLRRDVACLPVNHRFGLPNLSSGGTVADCLCFNFKETDTNVSSSPNGHRPAGVPSIRSDIPSKSDSSRSFSDHQNYGDQPDIHSLLHPSLFDLPAGQFLTFKEMENMVGNAVSREVLLAAWPAGETADARVVLGNILSLIGKSCAPRRPLLSFRPI